jgi:hypothetical protein
MCHGPQQRAVQAVEELIRRAEARRLDGRFRGHDNQWSATH